MILPPDLRQVLDGCGLPWWIEVGGRHRKVIVDGYFVAILPKSNVALRSGTPRTRKNALAFIRQGIRRVQEKRNEGHDRLRAIALPLRLAVGRLPVE
jgi:hypothetical protein